jgi:hypothetical protein
MFAEPGGPSAAYVLGQYELVPQQHQFVDVDVPPDIVVIALSEDLFVNPEPV